MRNQTYKPRNFEHLFGTPGFSDKLLQIHFKLYEGYVKNTNEILKIFESAGSDAEEKDIRVAELRRRFGWEFDGMRLHEYYFGNIGRDAAPLSPQSALARKIEADFGSFERWQKNFLLAGTMRGIGWVMLYHDPIEDRLLNVWIDEHAAGHPAGCEPLLVMDVFEHAYFTDYASEKERYLSVFWKAVQWEEVQQRFERSGSREAPVATSKANRI